MRNHTPISLVLELLPIMGLSFVPVLVQTCQWTAYYAVGLKRCMPTRYLTSCDQDCDQLVPKHAH